MVPKVIQERPEVTGTVNSGSPTVMAVQVTYDNGMAESVDVPIDATLTGTTAAQRTAYFAVLQAIRARAKTLLGIA